jgi:hypothetical protein
MVTASNKATAMALAARGAKIPGSRRLRIIRGISLPFTIQKVFSPMRGFAR